MAKLFSFPEIFFLLNFVENRDQLNRNSVVNEQSILKLLYNWSPAKKKFSENEAIDTMSWMKENNFIPSK